jgi:hypothetical protein
MNTSFNGVGWLLQKHDIHVGVTHHGLRIDPLIRCCISNIGVAYLRMKYSTKASMEPVSISRCTGILPWGWVLVRRPSVMCRIGRWEIRCRPQSLLRQSRTRDRHGNGVGAVSCWSFALLLFLSATSSLRHNALQSKTAQDRPGSVSYSP